MEDRARVVIVGAGIVGCSAAEHLTRLGWRDVVVLDQGPLFEAGGSTSHAPGLMFQTNPSKTMTDLAKYGVGRYTELELDGQPCGYQVGGIEVAETPERWHDLKRKRGLATSWGLEAHLISPEECAEKIPLLEPDKIRGGLFVPSDGIAKGVRACEAMARLATERGAKFYGETEVTGIETKNGRVRVVETDKGRVETELVVSCAGMWGPRIGRMVGMNVPLVPMQHQFVWTTPVAELAGETRGGTLVGGGQAFRGVNPDDLRFAVEPDESCTILCGEVGEHLVEGISDGFVPGIFRRHRELMDGIVSVTSEEAIGAMRYLAREHGLFVGPSSGANLVAARRVQEAHPELENIVTLFCDEGEKYISEHFRGTEGGGDATK